MKFNGLENFFKTDENGKIVDFSQTHSNGDTPLMFAMYHNKSERFYLDSEQFEFLINKSDLNQINLSGQNSLMYYLCYQQYEHIKLNSFSKNHLLKNSDLKIFDYRGYNALIHYIINIDKINNDDLSFLLYNSDLKQKTRNNNIALSFFLQTKYSNNDFNLQNTEWKYLIDNSDLSFIEHPDELIQLKKIKSELLNDEILSKVNIKEDKIKLNQKYNNINKI